MDRSYRLKMEQKLIDNILTDEYVINCIAKYENKINQLAYKEKKRWITLKHLLLVELYVQ